MIFSDDDESLEGKIIFLDERKGYNINFNKDIFFFFNLTDYFFFEPVFIYLHSTQYEITVIQNIT